MNGTAAKVAVVGGGISGAVCASTLAKNGVSVILFESARGPGGRMSQRREKTEDGKELLFDHGTPFFMLSKSGVSCLVREWESRGLVAEWKEKIGCFDFLSNKFVDIEQEGTNQRFVGVPGMNSICRALCSESRVESKFGVGIGRFDWSEDENLWLLTGLDGQKLGCFKGVVASDKSIVSPRITNATRRLLPLDLSIAPELAAKLQAIPVKPCFALMLAFSEPLSSIPVKGFSIQNSDVLSWAHCDSSKPGRSTMSERWILHSTPEYADRIIAQTGLQKPSDATLTKVAEELLQELQSTGLNIPQPFFKRAHRWGSAFPATSIAREEKCLWDRNKRLAICGDFCVSPNVEGAIDSGLAAASKLIESISCL
ncbi:FAD/NAD(P)-binding oxidoreductase family protein [Quillaja saponaria]|uniref:FAD/NAD(P)-binding oxidoreductase family protein n=1 Tax=Quillaja saponaria TaxID=32244 RepID=A0AAD7KZQ3_QUISA|nr:FAD/NAD(P)-binding oxidoreductase family protein [Quillaja saponaria]